MKRAFSTVVLAVVAVTVLGGSVWAQDSLNVREAGRLHSDWSQVLGVAVQDSFAYVATGEGLFVVDVTYAVDPVMIGHCATPCQRAFVSGRYAYVVGLGNFSVIDVSNPLSPVEVGSVASFENGDWIIDMTGSGGTVYVVFDRSYESQFDQYLAVFDVSDPAHPALSGMQDFLILDGASVNDNYVYLSQADIGFTVCNRTDPFVPVHSDYTIHPTQVKVSGGNAYLSGDGHFYSMSLSDPTSPQIIGSCALTVGCACHMTVSGPYAFVGDLYNVSFQIINLMDPTSPVETGHYSRARSFNDFTASGSYAYVAEDSLLIIYDCSQAAASRQARTELPRIAELLPCYPNPFNASTTIRYELPVSANVSLNVFDVTGRRVAGLASGTQTAGTHELRFDGSNLGSGVYFVRLAVGGYQTQQKVVMLK